MPRCCCCDEKCLLPYTPWVIGTRAAACHVHFIIASLRWSTVVLRRFLLTCWVFFLMRVKLSADTGWISNTVHCSIFLLWLARLFIVASQTKSINPNSFTSNLIQMHFKRSVSTSERDNKSDIKPTHTQWESTQICRRSRKRDKSPTAADSQHFARVCSQSEAVFSAVHSIVQYGPDFVDSRLIKHFSNLFHGIKRLKNLTKRHKIL